MKSHYYCAALMYIAFMVGFAVSSIGQPTNCGVSVYPWYMPILVLLMTGYPAWAIHMGNKHGNDK